MGDEPNDQQTNTEATNESFVATNDNVLRCPLVETAEGLCGYRHDRRRFECGQPRFTRLEPTR